MRPNQKYLALREKAKVAQQDKIRNAEAELAKRKAQSVEEFMENDYSFRRANTAEDYDRILHMLELSAEDVISISAESDLARYL